MADQVQLRGGTTAQHAAFTGAVREATVDTTKKVIVVHDGATPGGIPMLREDLANLPAGTVAANLLSANVLDPQAFYKTDYTDVAFIKTGAQAVSLKAGTTIMVNGALLHYAANTAVTMPTLTAGSDYAIYANPNGTLQAVADSFASPSAAPQTGSRKIGGFHYGLVAPSTTPASGGFSTAGISAGGGSFGWTQADVHAIAGINKFSLWDLTWRCAGEQRGMAFDPRRQMWAGIYLMSDSPHVYGPSAYNTNVASGTVLPFIPAQWGGNGSLKYSRLSAFEAHELVSAFGLRLPTFEEFMSFAFGVTEAQSVGGAAVTIAATTRQPGYTSRIGIEQATGHQWIIGGPIHSTAGTAYVDVGRGQYYGNAGLVLLSGNRGGAADSGSRCANFGSALSVSAWSVGVRAAGDHLNLGAAAR